jgi:hypothetical protein
VNRNVTVPVGNAGVTTAESLHHSSAGLALHRASGHADHDLSLGEYGDDQHGQGHDECGGGGEIALRQLLEGQHT